MSHARLLIVTALPNRDGHGIFFTVYSTIRNKEQVDKKFREEWLQGMQTKTSLELCRVEPTWGSTGELDGSWESTLLVRARLCRMGLYGEAPKKARGIRCVCGEEEETVIHILTECGKYETERKWLVARLYRGWDADQWKDWKTRDVVEATACILGRGPVQLSQDQLREVKRFLGMIWRKRKQLRSEVMGGDG